MPRRTSVMLDSIDKPSIIVVVGLFTAHYKWLFVTIDFDKVVVKPSKEQ